MATKFKSMLVLFLALNLTACDEIDDLTDLEITEDFSTTITVDVEQVGEGEPQSIDEYAGIDISEVPEIEENFNLIESISVNAITFEIQNYSGIENATISNASLLFNGDEISIEDINLEAASDTGNTFEVSNAIVFTSIGNMLLNNSELSVGLSGEISGTPVKFDLILNFNLTVTADLL